MVKLSTGWETLKCQEKHLLASLVTTWVEFLTPKPFPSCVYLEQTWFYSQKSYIKNRMQVKSTQLWCMTLWSSSNMIGKVFLHWQICDVLSCTNSLLIRKQWSLVACMLRPFNINTLIRKQFTLQIWFCINLLSHCRGRDIAHAMVSLLRWTFTRVLLSLPSSRKRVSQHKNH